jgi:hypothetical protein
MSGIIIPLRTLERRRQVLQRLFQEISNRSNVKTFFKSGSTAVVLGLGGDDFGEQLRGARQASRVSNVFLNYFEVWTVQSGGREFLLDKAYLHLDVPFPDGTGDEEVLALHCDSLTPQYDPAYRYKRCLHLHVSSKKRDFSKAHISLCHGNWEQTCSDYQSFCAAMVTIIGMINAELLPRVANGV